MPRIRIPFSLLLLIVAASLFPIQSAFADPVSTARSSLYSYLSSKPTACATGGLPKGSVEGQVEYTRSSNLVSFDVSFHGQPNATYEIALACVSQVGQITTDGSGEGAGSFRQAVKQGQTEFFVTIRSVTPSSSYLASTLASLPNPGLPVK